MKTITFEGQDQIGKADVVKNVSKRLISDGYSFYSIAYPYYPLPFGFLAGRYFTQSDSFKSIHSIKNISNRSRELEIVGLLFAINRLETISTIKQFPERDFLLSDRGPYSLAVTLAYGLNNKLIGKRDLQRVIELYLDFDSHFRESLNTDGLIIQLYSEGVIGDVNVGKRKRDKNDVYESSTVQDTTRKMYELYAERIPGWMKIVTRHNNGEDTKWREREDILEDVISKLNERKVFEEKSAFSGGGDEIQIEDLAKVQYGVELDRSSQILLNNALKRSDKELIGKVSPNIARKIADNAVSQKFNWDNHSSLVIGKMIRQYPELLGVIEFYLGKGFCESFVRSVHT